VPFYWKNFVTFVTTEWEAIEAAKLGNTSEEVFDSQELKELPTLSL
jgi:hypothetical protein